MRDFLADATSPAARSTNNLLEWIKDLPIPQAGRALLESMLAWQLERQAGADATASDTQIAELARRLAALTVAQDKDRLHWLSNFLLVAEFLARESRNGA